MSSHINVTGEFEFALNDDELLPIKKCSCGARFPLWHFSIGIYPDDPSECPECGRKFYWRTHIEVIEVVT